MKQAILNFFRKINQLVCDHPERACAYVTKGHIKAYGCLLCGKTLPRPK